MIWDEVHILNLEDLLLPQPFPAIVSVLTVLGLLQLGEVTASSLRNRRPEVLDVAGGFVLVTAVVSVVLQLLVWGHLAAPPVLRALAWTLVICGLFRLRVAATSIRSLRLRFNNLRNSNLGLLECAGLILGAVATSGLLVSALGPPTDFDSLDYHLGIPLEWLRHAGADLRPDWLHSRLAGSGEALNMLGLAAGTDSLGAVFQAAGLLVAIVAVSALARTVRDRILALLLVAASPIMTILVPVQKYQLFPAAATTLALILVVRRRDELDLVTVALAMGATASAVNTKDSFLLSAAVLVALTLVLAYRSKRLRGTLGVTAACFAVLVLPSWLHSLAVYGDPISPFLEQWKSNPDPVVVTFAHDLRTGGSPEALQGDLVRAILLPSSPTEVSQVLGFGIAGFLLVLSQRGTPRVILLAVLAAAAAQVALSQLTPRFFLEPYLWISAAVVHARTRLKPVFFGGILIQAVLAAGIAVVIAWSRAPGIFTRSSYQQVMQSSAYGYSGARWLDQMLPKNGVLLTTLTSHALLPRPFIPWEPQRFFVPDQVQQEWLTRLLASGEVSAIVVDDPEKVTKLQQLAGSYVEPLVGPETFTTVPRNPFNTGGSYSLYVFRVTVPAARKNP